ncbi:SDR family oxidoreductase [Alkanindiges illinoisensis]|uniref:SDR family oxidoreductase n=1 Tax=Alkanindiges illinoisensis TaxID=197183 RepID=UPI0006851193|nr:SDR family oxidoreductase [Alkanindiges illinoisensis]
MKTVLVTGASGFIGRYLVLKLLQQGEYIFALFRSPAKQLPQLQAWLQQHGIKSIDLSRIEGVQGDFSQPELGIGQVDWQRMQQVTVVYQCAALYQWNLTQQQARLINVTAPLRLMQLASQYCQLRRFVQISGYMLKVESHLQKLGIDRQQPDQTNWPQVYKKVGSYEASKLETHFVIKDAARQQGIALTLILPAAIIGDSQHGELDAAQPIYQTFRDLLQQKLAAIPGSSKHRLPMISVDYVAEFMAKIVSVPESNTQKYLLQEYLLLDNATPSLQQALEIAATAGQVKAPKKHIPIAVLQWLSRWRWLATKLNIAAEALPFIRTEHFDTRQADDMAQKLGLHKPAIADVIQKTAFYVQQDLSR